jgi:high-affinity iron transporter
LYWLVVIIGFLVMGYKERTGHFPLQKSKVSNETHSDTNSAEEVLAGKKTERGASSAAVREVPE